MSASRLVVRVKTENAAFEDDNLRPELARILRKVAEQIEDGSEDHRLIFDFNGNSVGGWVLK